MSMDWLKTTFNEPGGLPLTDIIVRLSVSFVFGLAVAGLHVCTRPPSKPEGPRLGTSLVMLCVLIAIVSQVVGNNAARAFSLVGAVSVIRFRTPLEDTRDTAFVLFAVILGMASGVGYFEVGLLGLLAVGVTTVGFMLRNIVPSAAVWHIDIRVPAGKSVERILEIVEDAGDESPDPTGPAKSEPASEKKAAKAKAAENGPPSGAGKEPRGSEEATVGVATMLKRCDFVSGCTVKQGTLMEYRYKIVLRPGVTALQLIAEISKHEDCHGVDIKQA